MAMAALRNSPLSLARFTGDPRKVRRNSSMFIPEIHSREGLTSSVRGAKAGSGETGARRFHGQTSWQISQPNRCRPIFARSSSGAGSALLDGEIGDAAGGVELARRNQSLSRAGVQAARAGAAAVGGGQVGRQPMRAENHSEKKPRAKLLIENAAILADPSNAGVRRQHPLGHRAGIDIAPGARTRRGRRRRCAPPCAARCAAAAPAAPRDSRTQRRRSARSIPAMGRRTASSRASPEL